MRRDGVVLVLSILLILALSILAVGVVMVGTMESSVATALQRAAEARALAELGARSIFEAWSTAAVRDLPPGSLRAGPPVGRAIKSTIERVDSLLFLVRTEARLGGRTRPPTVGRAALLVATPDHAALERAFPAALAVEAEAWIDSGRVSGYDACPVTAVDRPGLIADSAAVSPRAELGGAPAWSIAAPEPLPPGSLLESPTVRDIATVIWTAALATPRPSSAAGTCLPEPGNWGAVADGHPCHDRLPLVYATGDLAIDAGEIRGILVVDGDLDLTGTVELAGIVRVRGMLRIGPDAHVTGAVRAASVQMSGGSILRDGCEIAAALDAPALDRAFRPGRRWWVPSL